MLSPWNMSLKSSLSPPSTTSSTTSSHRSTSGADYFSYLSPSALLATSPSQFSPSSPANHCAYPSWPQRASLSPSLNVQSDFSYQTCNSRISDEDLRDLECWTPREPEIRVEEEQGISWSQLGQVQWADEIPTNKERRRGPPPEQNRRRKSSSNTVKSRRGSKGRTMVTITE
ncbi:MAG: hypothetical protein MMC33_003862 [Icmadophila ericetorum]|nr:hypothetical protein [Icmadophila ericetorum]